MTEAEKREKVIKGLEICSAGEWNSTGGRDHTDCPYYPAGYTGCTCKLLMRDALALLKAQEPRVHGRWMECEDGWGDCHYQCSECGCEWCLNDGTPEENGMNYCPNCGAKMDGEART